MNPSTPVPNAPARTLLLDLALALILAVLPFLIYPGSIELAGDQAIQIVAAQALADEGHLRVTLRTDDPRPAELVVGSDLRRTLRWFPPGYSILIAAGLKLGLAVTTVAAFWFFICRVAIGFFWLRIGRHLGLPMFETAGAVLLGTLLFYPSTTTDGFAVALVGALLLVFLKSGTAPRLVWWGLPILLLAVTIRWAAAPFAVIWFAWHAGRFLLEKRRPDRATIVALLVTSGLPVLWYFSLSLWCAGALSPLTRHDTVVPTNWLLIGKGLYFAFIGGWSPVASILKLAGLGLSIVTAAAAVRAVFRGEDARKKLAFPLLVFQLLMVAYLICAQILVKGHYYGPDEPAFATARFYSLVQPGSILLLMSAGDWGFPKLARVARIAVAAFLIIAAGQWILKNRDTRRHLMAGTDGFLRTEKVIRFHRELAATRNAAVLSDLDVEIYTGTDSRTLYPLGFEGISVPEGGRIVVVTGTSPLPATHLASRLAQSLQPESVRHCDDYVLRSYVVPPGFRLASRQ